MPHFLTDRIRIVKFALVSAAIIIAGASLYVSHVLISDLKQEEQSKMEVWAEAMQSLIRADANADLNLVLKVINSNRSIPIIVVDGQGKVTDFRNIETDKKANADAYLRDEAAKMKNAGHCMNIELSDEQHADRHSTLTVCYGESVMLKRLATYPYIQLGVAGLFIVVAIFALLSSKRAEQNKVWVGLSRETAHQLGTPISSLMAWTEILKETYPEEVLINDMSTDVERLQLIAERFSKIGSAPDIHPENLEEVINHAVRYISRRTSRKVKFITEFPPGLHVAAPLCAPLFEWVIENLCKNAIDAMSGQGIITLRVTTVKPKTVIEISDTGKGMNKAQARMVFRPGYTTKKRGWGLGLPLAKRIIEQYHNGHIYVKSSEAGIGTTFCIELPNA